MISSNSLEHVKDSFLYVAAQGGNFQDCERYDLFGIYY